MKTDRGPVAYCAECERIALANGEAPNEKENKA